MSDAGLIILEIYLPLSLISFVCFAYCYKKLKEDLQSISYYFLEHHHDIRNHFNENLIRETTEDEIKKIEYLVAVKKAKKYKIEN
jgi:hypothetical protein